MGANCKVSINISTHQVRAKVTKAWNEATPYIAMQVLDDCNRYCKEDTGALIASSYEQSDLDKGIIRWRTEYARRQYWIKTAKKDKNPQASWKWAEVAKKKHGREWTRMAQYALRENMKKE